MPLDENGMRRAAEAIHGMGPRWVLVKGGHAPGRAVDILFDGRSWHRFEGPRIDTPHTHGSGCVLSAALAFFLAQGLETPEAVRRAKGFINRAVRRFVVLGQGRGPVNPSAQLVRWEERAQVLEDLRLALDRLLRQPIGGLIPEIRSNFGYALENAEDASEVAAVPGRISQIGDRLVIVAQPAFGASRHIARVILTAMRFDPSARSAMNVRYSPEILEACRSAGLTGASFDRADEPTNVRVVEGSSLEWGTERALSGGGRAPDFIYDRGGLGKEPVIRMLGRTPDQVADRVLEAGARLGANRA